MVDSASEVSGRIAGDAGLPSDSAASPARSEEPTGRSEGFETCVEDIRKRLGSNIPFLFPRLEDEIRRRLGLAPLGPGAAALAGLTGCCMRLAIALVATAAFGEWTGIAWGRWAVILTFYGLMDATQPMRSPPLDVPSGARVRRMVDDWTALLPTIVKESDLRELAGFVHRWQRLPVAAVFGVVVAATMLGSCILFTPTALSELPAGSIVLLALLLYDFGAIVFNPIYEAFLAREATYDHHLFWPSPVDSPEVQKAMRMTTFFGFATGMWITIYLLLALILVSWESPLVLPLALGFIVIGYLATIGLSVADRASIQKIVQRARHQRLGGLRNRIDTFGPRYTDLSPRESGELRDLLELHNMIRDAPTAPTTTHTVMHAILGLIIPTIMFIMAVLGEVYAERFLDAVLP